MTTITRANRLPMIIGVTLFMIALVMVLATWLGGGYGTVVMRTVPPAPTPDADSPATVVKTLSAQVEAVKEQNSALNDANAALRKKLDDLQASLDRAPAPPKSDDSFAKSLADKMNELVGRVQNLEITPVKVPELPIGQARDPHEIVWLEPLDADRIKAKGEGGGLLPVKLDGVGVNGGDGFDRIRLPQAPVNGTSEEVPAPTQPPPAATARPPKEEKPIPYYTIPADSTLMGATAWTAILGRIPVGGQVPDPWRFKVLTGADNLAANGIEIPNLTGMVWSGVATGDLTLRCVSGRLDSVTYVFQDGTINTVRGQGGRGLGWISDASGIPCIPGSLKTNAPSFLATRMALLALQGGADAVAAGEITTNVGPLGNSTTSVTGDRGRFVLGRSLSGGAEEAQRWVDERVSQSFDAVFLLPGATVTINVEEEIAIDYRPNGRPVSYARRSSDPYRSPRLD